MREGRALRPARGYRIRFAQEDLNFRPLEVTDPMPLGRRILTAAGREPVEGYSLFAILPSGDFEDVRLDEPFDLRGAGRRALRRLPDRPRLQTEAERPPAVGASPRSAVRYSRRWR